LPVCFDRETGRGNPGRVNLQFVDQAAEFLLAPSKPLPARFGAAGRTPDAAVLHFLIHTDWQLAPSACDPYMLFSKEYVGYLAREVTKKLIAGKFIEASAVPAVTERVHAALVDELALEDRINDEVRVILEAYSEEMHKTGANYQEMFRKVKTELVRKYKAVL
jgi:hypothetical protein